MSYFNEKAYEQVKGVLSKVDYMLDELDDKTYEFDYKNLCFYCPEVKIYDREKEIFDIFIEVRNGRLPLFRGDFENCMSFLDAMLKTKDVYDTQREESKKIETKKILLKYDII